MHSNAMVHDAMHIGGDDRVDWFIVSLRRHLYNVEVLSCEEHQRTDLPPKT